jgi:PAS domain S-box-containing protein
VADGTVDRVCLADTDILSAIFKSLAVGVVVCDVDGKLIFFNPEAERILGSGAMHAEVAEWSALYGCYRPDMATPYPPEELPLARATRGEEALHELIFIRNPRQPAGLWIDASGKPLRDSSGTLRGGVVVFSDVSVLENLRRNKAVFPTSLTRAREPGDPVEDHRDVVSERFSLFRTMYGQLAMAVEQTADSIMITDNRGIIEYVNPAFEEITGYSAAEVLGRRPSVLKSGKHDAEFYRDLWGKLASGERFRGTIINRKKSGELYWSDQTISPIRNAVGGTTHFVSVLKDMTASREKQERDFQLQLAREIQQRYYNTTASLPGFDIAAAAYPADETGGDYFDFLPQPDGSLYIIVADIAGHGLGSAFLMAETRATLRAYATMTPDISFLLGCLNRSLAGSLSGNRFVTMFLGRIDPQTRSLEYASAGHETGYLLRYSGDIGAVLGSTVPPLGIFPAQEFCSQVVPLEHGDTIVLLTDGITESMNADGGLFGSDGALDFLIPQRQSTAAELVRGLYLAARAFAGGESQVDDITSVICKVE